MLAPGSAVATADPLLLHCWRAEEEEGPPRRRFKKEKHSRFFFLTTDVSEVILSALCVC